jgi:hypothetical protein
MSVFSIPEKLRVDSLMEGTTRPAGVGKAPPGVYRLITVLLLVATSFYLLTEIAFTSYLIEFLGAPRTAAEVLDIEHIGRRLTGIALALVLFPIVINLTIKVLGYSFQTMALIVVLVLPLTAFTSYHFVVWGIEKMVVGLTDNTTLASRQNALLVSAVVGRLHQTDDHLPVLTLNGEFVPNVLGKSVQQKIVLAALPFLISSVPEMRQKMMAALEATVRKSIRRRLGSDEQAYNDLFVRPMHDLIAPTYDGFVKALNAYRTARYERVRRADEEFDRYREELAQRRLTIDVAKRSKRVMDAVAKKIIAENPRFRQICDRKGIPDSVADFDEVVEHTIEDEYAGAIQNLDLVGLAPPAGDFTPDQFVALPQTKSLWGRRIGEHVKNDALARRIGEFGPRAGDSATIFGQFQSVVLTAYIDEEVASRMADVGEQIDRYVSGSEVAQRAYSATKSIIVIPIAIMFSMFGALTHFTKVGVLLLQLVGLGFFKAMTICVTVTVLVVTSLTRAYRDEMSDWRASAPIIAGLSANFGDCGTTAFRTTVVVQSRLYPIGLGARHRFSILEYLFPFQPQNNEDQIK